MKPTAELEPGVLLTFRRFVGLHLAITLLGALAHWLVVPFQPWSSVGTLVMLSILQPALLFLYLSLPRLQRTFKLWYFPIGIVGAVAGPLLDPYLNLHTSGNNAPAILAQVFLWRQIILLMIPLVVVSWQYTMHQVVWFCGLTATLNVALLSQTWTFQEMISHSLLGIVAIQTVIFLLVGQMIVNLMQIQRAQRQRLAQYAATLEQLTISRERNRMARELHDVLAHTLSGVAVELEGVRSLLRLDLERANGLLGHALQTIREGLSETRRTLRDLRARPLEDLGLALAVQALADSYTGRFGFQVELMVDPDLGDYPDAVQQCIYRIAQEALANVAEHARAQTVQVVLTQEQGQLRLRICDDGCGFAGNGDQWDPENTLADSSIGKHCYGLLGMYERAEMSGGQLAVESQVGRGTQIYFSYGDQP